MDALFTNIAHLFWQLPKDDGVRIYPWLPWYVWKSRNDKLFSNLHRDPRELINLAVAEANAWFVAQQRQELLDHQAVCFREGKYHEGRCQIDGSWKITSPCAGLRWFYCNTQTGDILMGNSNLRRGLSPLQTEVEVLIWAMQCMLRHNKRSLVFETNCSDLVQMVTNPEEWLAFSILLEEVEKCRKLFSDFSIIHIPRKNNKKADKLARTTRGFLHDVYFVNSVPPAWIFKPF